MIEMGAIAEGVVLYTVRNIERCRCPQCPVQARSPCVKKKTRDLKNEIRNSPGDKAPKPQEVPGVYCSSGDATCKDLDPNQQCMCKKCAVWAEHDLVTETPMMYFCNNGKAGSLSYR